MRNHLMKAATVAAFLCLIVLVVFGTMVATYDPVQTPTEPMSFEECRRLEDKNLTHYLCTDEAGEEYYVLADPETRTE